MWVTRSPSRACSVRMRATELPTVPKPKIATDQDRVGVRGPASAGSSGATLIEGFKVVVGPYETAAAALVCKANRLLPVEILAPTTLDAFVRTRRERPLTFARTAAR